MIKGNIILFIVVSFILLVCALLFRQKKSYNKAPRKIWTYCENPEKLPKIYLKTWEKYNPDYEIVILTRKNFKGYVTIPTDILSYPHFQSSTKLFSDLLKLYTLSEHGGIWINSTTLIKQNFDTWLFTRPELEVSGFYIDSFTKDAKVSPVIDPSFIACIKKSKYIELWKNEFIQIVKYPNIEEYINSRKSSIDFTKIPNQFENVILIAALKPFQIDKYSLDTLSLRKAEEMPYRYLVDTKWNSEKGLKLACLNKSYQTPIMIMREEELINLEKELDYDLNLNKCGWTD